MVFLLVDIGIFIDFLALQKEKTKMCSVDSCMSSIFKKDQENQSVHQIKNCKKRQDCFTVCSFYIHSKAHTERCASNKGKLKFDVNSIPDLIRDKKYLDTVIIYIFSSSLGRYCEDSAWAECLKL